MNFLGNVLRTIIENGLKYIDNNLEETMPDYLLKKCVYNNDDQSCTQKIRTCAEKSYDSNASDEYCKQFSVSSSDKLCVAGVNGCVEIEKENNSNNSNSSYELKLSKMVFILLYLLF